MDSKKRTDERKRLYWMAVGRGLLCVFAAGIVRLNLEPSAAPDRLLPFAVILAAFAANLFCLPIVRTKASARTLAAAGISLDVLLVSALVYSTGGANSEFLLLYFGPILAAAVSFSRTGTVLVASFSTIGLFACAMLYGFAGPRPPLVAGVWLARYENAASSLAGILALQASAFHVVAFLASTLAQRLRRAAIEMRQILENMTDGVVTVDQNGCVVFANSPARAVLSLDRGRPLIGELIDGLLPAPVSLACREVLSLGRARTLEVEVGANAVPVQVVVVPVSDASGGIRGANVILHDISERRKLMEALRRADRLEATATTVASIAHEIRNPVAAIRGGAQELKNVLNLRDPEAPLLDLVVRESDRLNRILTEFLNFSRMPRPQVVEFDLRRLLDEVATQVSVSRPGCAPDVGVSGPGEFRMKADAEQLRQVFVNIGLNSVDATDGKGPVVFEIRPEDGGVAVLARDRGCGIDDSIADRVFEPFFTTKTTGTGLGLAIAKRIVEDHAGTITVGGDGDGWTCVRVFLPAAAAQSDAGRAVPIAGTAGSRLLY